MHGAYRFALHFLPFHKIIDNVSMTDDRQCDVKGLLASIQERLLRVDESQSPSSTFMHSSASLYRQIVRPILTHKASLIHNSLPKSPGLLTP